MGLEHSTQVMLVMLCVHSLLTITMKRGSAFCAVSSICSLIFRMRGTLMQ